MPARSKLIWFTVGACVAAAVLSVAFLYSSMRWRKAHAVVEPYEVIARANGWSHGSRDLSTATVERFRQDPATVVDLLCHDSRKVREAVNSVGRELRFPTEMLDRLGNRLPTLPEYKQYQVARFLSDQGPEGLRSLFKIFDRSTSIADRPELRELLRHTMAKVGREELQLLLKVAADETKPLLNRLLAIELLGFTNDSPWLITELKLLNDGGDLAIRSAATVAILRLTDSLDPARLAADLKWYRANEPYTVANFLLETAKLGEAAHAFGPSALAELEAHNPETVDAAAMTLARIGYREAIPELLRMLDSDDWIAAGSAAEALGRLHAQDAEAPLRKAEREHWKPSVREVAAQAIAAIHPHYDYPPSDRGRAVPAIRQPSSLAPGSFPAPKPPSSWNRRFDAASAFLEELRVEFVRLTAPAYDQMDVVWPDGRRLKDQAYDMLPRYRLRFGPGVLLGYNEGEFGAGLAYVPDRGTAVFYPIPNVTQLIHWQGKVVVVTTGVDNQVWLVEPQKDCAPKVKFFKRLPLFFDQCSKDSHGNLYFSGILQITAAGELKPM